jgi:hypothetical protein
MQLKRLATVVKIGGIPAHAGGARCAARSLLFDLPIAVTRRRALWLRTPDDRLLDLTEVGPDVRALLHRDSALVLEERGALLQVGDGGTILATGSCTSASGAVIKTAAST